MMQPIHPARTMRPYPTELLLSSDDLSGTPSPANFIIPGEFR